MYCCINYVLVFALFTIILLLRTVWTIQSNPDGPNKKWKQTILGQFSIFSLQNWTIVCLNHPYDWLVSFDCTDLSSDSLKKEGLCLKIVLGQAWFELYCTVIIFFCTHSTSKRIRRALPPQSALPPDAIWCVHSVYLCRIIAFTMVKMVFELFLWISVKI